MVLSMPLATYRGNICFCISSKDLLTVMIIQATWARPGVPILLLADGVCHPVDRPGTAPPLNTLLSGVLLAVVSLLIGTIKVGLPSQGLGGAQPIRGLSISAPVMSQMKVKALGPFHPGAWDQNGICPRSQQGYPPGTSWPSSSVFRSTVHPLTRVPPPARATTL